MKDLISRQVERSAERTRRRGRAANLPRGNGRPAVQRSRSDAHRFARGAALAADAHVVTQPAAQFEDLFWNVAVRGGIVSFMALVLYSNRLPLLALVHRLFS